MNAHRRKVFKNFSNIERSASVEVVALYHKIIEHPDFHAVKSGALYNCMMSAEHFIQFRNAKARKDRQKLQVEALSKMLFVLNTISEVRDL